VNAMGFPACRSTHNNKYCADDVVLLLDGNTFSEDGAIGYDLTDDVPIYGKDGKTSVSDQMRTS
jgi:hypothetical protein